MIGVLLLFFPLLDGGADRNRTCDLLIANETLCQLSYDPNQTKPNQFNCSQLRRDSERYRTYGHPTCQLLGSLHR